MRAHPQRPRPTQDPPALRERPARPKVPEGLRSFRALIHELRALPQQQHERGASLETTGSDLEGEEASASLAAPTAARVERSVEPGERRMEARATGPQREPPSPEGIEFLQAAADSRALRLKVGGRAGWASVEIELRDDDGELSLAIATEDGDHRRATRWAREIDEALARRGLSSRVIAD